MNKLYIVNADFKGDALSVVEQALNQIPAIKSFIMEKQVRRKIFSQYDNVFKNEMKISVWNSLLQTVCSTALQIPSILFMIYAGFIVMGGILR